MPVESIEDKIDALRKERRAVILAHNYQCGEVQDIADVVGDSLELARRAREADAEVIVLCGVHFMAETAAILNPEKTVVIPDKNAGCPMACMVSAKGLKGYLAEHPKAYVVSYVNTTAEVKAMSDICCTSANAVKVVESVPAGREIVFLPDRNLGHWIIRKTGREMTLWEGFCPTHARILPEFIEDARAAHPEAELCVHPECAPAVVDMADFVGSTSQILRHCAASERKSFIIGTEIGILHTLGKLAPGKEFFPATKIADCPNMKLITMEKVFWALRDLEDRVEVPPDVAAKARGALERMVAITG
ncbi:MAG: quinolinate synthase NadA [Planctomycetota bacterium]